MPSAKGKHATAKHTDRGSPAKAAAVRSVTVADASRGNWVDAFAPDWLKPYARLARWDRPIGFWLLFWPCAFSLALAALANRDRGMDWTAVVLMLIGSVAMRGAGCTLNDIVDADLDAKVARTRARPIPAGQVTKRRAAVFLLLQLLVGVIIVCAFNLLTIGLAAASLVLIAIYPFMKRITWWPQLFLGLAFSYGAILGWTSQMDALSWPPVLMYLGSIAWVIGYDTIYALQDIEDDALIGIRSTARLFGKNVQAAVALFYVGAVVLWTVAVAMTGDIRLFPLALVLPVCLLGWQIISLDTRTRGNALSRFKMNNWVGLALTLAILLEVYV
jgi:4-hydroxybenzoate polyprenyltransferase